MAHAGEMMAREFPYITSHANENDGPQLGSEGRLQAAARKPPYAAFEKATH